MIRGWYTRSRRDSVVAIVRLVPPEDRDMSAREAATRFRELVGDIPDADEIQVNYTLQDDGPDVTYLLLCTKSKVITFFGLITLTISA